MGIEDVWMVLVSGITVGVVAMVFIVREVASRDGGRPVLAVALGIAFSFGLISLSVKAALIYTLGVGGTGTLDQVGKWSADVAPKQAREKAEIRVRPPVAPARRPWAVLPASLGIDDAPQVVALGHKLFYDPRLSSTGTVACASCHRLEDGGDDDSAVSTGIEGLKGGRNAPTVWNAARLSRLFWEGRAASLEQQALGPIVNPVEMGMSGIDAAVDALKSVPGYRKLFTEAFPGRAEPIAAESIGEAIAAFERTLLTGPAPYDRLLAGETGALSAQQIRGMALFDSLGCRSCHIDPVFSAAGTGNGAYRPFPVFSDAPLVAEYDLLADKGRPGVEDDRAFGLWRVPSLRNVELTAPYFHNGSVDTLEEAVRVMVTAQLGRRLTEEKSADVSAEWVAGRNIANLNRGRAVSEAEIRDIAAFLRALTGTLPDIGRPDLPGGA